ncbi:BspA family leucine-rich repeat surface protein [Candidatus Saccharibacteria bacterium]|nr:BspA family leucine-rich repeat surface protein [Candidatus Saccharibacteria bacterium]
MPNLKTFIATSVSLTIISAMLLTSPRVSADTSATSRVSLIVPSVCSLTIGENSGTEDDIYNSIYPSTYDTIGTSHLRATCNDGDGLAIYAVGYSGNTQGNTDLISAVNSNITIPTNLYTSGGNAGWHMLVENTAGIEGDHTAVISDGTNNTEDFTTIHTIPSSNTKIASYPAITDRVVGTNINVTFKAYVSPGQPAGTYNGKVKYTLVHPTNHPIPNETELEAGSTAAIKIKSLVSGTTKELYEEDTSIKAIRMADSLPDGFVPSEANTISAEGSEHPVYMFFDNTDGAGILYFYSGDYGITLGPDATAMFAGNTNLTDISGLANWDTSGVTNLTDVFWNCSSLSDISALVDWDTSNVESISYMFGKTAITSLHALSNWDTSNFTDISGAFTDTNITSLHGLENWDISNVTTLYDTFWRTTSLTDISAIADWDTSNVTDMEWTFGDTVVLTDLSPIENWDTSKVKDMYSMFGCMYVDCSPKTDFSFLADWDISELTDTGALFAYTGVTDISPVADWDTSKITNMTAMFAGTNITNIDALATGKNDNPNNWNTENVKSMRAMFAGAESLVSVDGLTNWDTSNVEDMAYMFSGDKSIETINVSNWDTGKVTTMSSMFQVGDSYVANGKLSEIIGLGNFDTSNVTDMTCMFYGAGQMTSYDVSDWDVSKVESFSHMFCDNRKLASLDLSRWNVSSVKTMNNMFDDNYKLTTVGDVSHWNTSSLLDAGGWINWCTSFVGDNGTLDLTGWDTSNLKSAQEMFRDTKLEVIDLTGWTFDAISKTKWEGAGTGIFYEYTLGLNIMFKNTKKLTVVYVSQEGLDSYNRAVERGVNITDMWLDSAISEFTVKPTEP